LREVIEMFLEDGKTRFLARAGRGSVKRGLALLDKLDRSFARRGQTRGKNGH
jgi:hypothetical protein